MVGIVTRSNLMHAMVSMARGAPACAEGDAAIRDRLLAEIQKEHWAPIATVNVVVTDGVVELWGAVSTSASAKRSKWRPRTSPASRRSKDHLGWIEPISGLVIESKEGAPAHQATAVA